MTPDLCWYRVFGFRPAAPKLEDLRASCRVTADDLGWYQAYFPLPSGEIEVNRWTPEEDDIRPELNTWAAWVEANSGPDLHWLMQRLIATTQLITWSIDPAAADVVGFSDMLCRFLTKETSGVYQVDFQGFFDAEGALLVPESS